MDPLYVDVISRAGIQDVVDQHLALARADPRVTEHAWTQWIEVPEILFVERLCCLLEHPELELGGKLRGEASVVGSLAHPPQEIAGTRGVGLPVLGVEVDEKICGVGGVGQNAERGRVDSR